MTGRRWLKSVIEQSRKELEPLPWARCDATPQGIGTFPAEQTVAQPPAPLN